MAKSRKRSSKPVKEHIEAAQSEAASTPATAPEAVAESSPIAVETAPQVEPSPEGDIFDAAITARQAGQFEPPATPDTSTRVEEALASGQLMRGSELEARGPEAEQDGNGPNRWAGVVRDSKNLLRIDKETEKRHDLPFKRILISFRSDAKPGDKERSLLKEAGFKFDGESWGKELTGDNVLLAKQVVNQIYKMRGDDYQIFV
jgi:hypothetical protein